MRATTPRSRWPRTWVSGCRCGKATNPRFDGIRAHEVGGLMGHPASREGSGLSTSFDAMWAAIPPIGRSSATGGYRRYALTRTDHDLREWFAGEASARDLDLTTDRMGNQWAWWGNPDASSGIVTGSHLDSVPDGGPFDGPLGVVSSFAALDRLRAADVELGRPVAVVNFVDEEGARFGVACAGSRLLTGALDADRARALADAHGVTTAAAMARAGHDAAGLGRDDVT